MLYKVMLCNSYLNNMRIEKMENKNKSFLILILIIIGLSAFIPMNDAFALNNKVSRVLLQDYSHFLFILFIYFLWWKEVLRIQRRLPRWWMHCLRSCLWWRRRFLWGLYKTLACFNLINHIYIYIYIYVPNLGIVI